MRFAQRFQTQVLRSVLASLAAVGSLSASTITYNPAPILDTGWNSCATSLFASLAGYSCRTTAYFEAMGLSQEWQNNPGGIAPVFNVGFDAWNTKDNKSTNAAGTNQGWTLAKAADPGGTLTVSIAKAEQFNAANNIVVSPVAKGGVEIQIAPNAALLATLNAAVTALGGDAKITWVQGLYDNYTTAGTTVTPFYEMDTTSATNPSYTDSYGPQPAGSGFYDQPKPRYQPFGTSQAFFYADAYIAIESVTNKTLDGLRRRRLRIQ